MVDCPERNRISRDISAAVRDEIRARRQASADPSQHYAQLVAARERLKRLRDDYSMHVAEHGCLPRDGATLAARSAS